MGIWAGTGGGLTFIKDGRLRNYTDHDGLLQNAVRSVYVDRADALWIGTDGGLSKFKDGRFTTYGAQYGLPSTQVRAICEDSVGSLWIGTLGSGLFRMKEGRVDGFGSVSFTAGASGTPAPTVQWQVSSGGAFTDISGATSTTLTLNLVTFAQNGSKYQAVFTNGCSTATSSAATLTVNTAPVVTTNPVSQSVAASAVTFTTAASGSPTPSLQWQVSTNAGATFTNIPGATSTTLTFSPRPSQSGYKYRAVFTNGCATAISSAATLTFFDTCIQDNTSKNTLQLNTKTGEYRFVRCTDGFTITGKGVLSAQTGIINLTDKQAGWVISAGFNPGQHTGSALIQIILAPGVSQTVRINDTNPANACGCS